MLKRSLWLAMTVTALFMITFALTAHAVEVPYISGGVGFDEREALRAKEGDYNVKVVTALKSGAYLSGVRVVIESAKQRPMLDTTMTGPILLAKLPPGSYTVKATAGDHTLTRTVTLEAKGLRRVDFRWDL